MSKRLVIDASVLQASGTSMHPSSRACREFLEHVRETCHRAAATEAMLAEWRTHHSKFAYIWRRTMYARRKIITVTVKPDETMRKRLVRVGLKDDERASVLKDAHLIEAALATDRIVISRDDSARALFDVAELSTVLWLNPVTTYPHCLNWLAAGAQPVEQWLLGRRR